MGINTQKMSEYKARAPISMRQREEQTIKILGNSYFNSSIKVDWASLVVQDATYLYEILRSSLIVSLTMFLVSPPISINFIL
jgi:spore germination protein YaaH